MEIRGDEGDDGDDWDDGDDGGDGDDWDDWDDWDDVDEKTKGQCFWTYCVILSKSLTYLKYPSG